MLTLDNLQITLGDRQWHFDIQLATEGVYTLLGRSGSGKSTLMNLIGGFVSPTAGDIRWNNESIVHWKPSERPVTTLFQQHNLFDHLTVWQNIGLGIAPDLRLDPIQQSRITDVLANVGLAGYDEKRPGSLSGGEQQRVALARCLLRRQPLLLLDEPFSALDGTTRISMIDLLRNLIDDFKPCVIMITHDKQDAIALNADILTMTNGTVLRAN